MLTKLWLELFPMSGRQRILSTMSKHRFINAGSLLKALENTPGETIEAVRSENVIIGMQGKQVNGQSRGRLCTATQFTSHASTTAACLCMLVKVRKCVRAPHEHKEGLSSEQSNTSFV